MAFVNTFLSKFALLFLVVCIAGKHGRGTGGAAPVSDAAGRDDAQGTSLPVRPAASGHVDPTWVSSMRADASRYGFDARRREPIRADSGLNRPVSAKTAETADSGRNSKKKKKKKNPERTGIGRNWCLIVLLIVFYLVLISNL